MFDHRSIQWHDELVLDGSSPELTRLLDRVRKQVTHYVSERRAAGVPIERVLPEVKRLVRQAQVAEGWSDPADVVMEQVVRWTITAFYDEPARRHVPLFY